MEFKDLEKIKNNKYSVKGAFAYYILGFYSCKKENVDDIIVSILEKLIEIKKENIVLSKIDSSLLDEIKNYWSLSIEQLISYACIIFNNLMFTKTKIKDIKEKDILDEFIYVMRIYSPDNAKKYVENKYIKNK